eukprot:1964800-Prymnesium_polylepis.1
MHALGMYPGTCQSHTPNLQTLMEFGGTGGGERVVRGAHSGGCWAIIKAGVRNQTRPTVTCKGHVLKMSGRCVWSSEADLLS